MNKVKSGFFALTEITDHTRHVEYNWWHSSDHQPENLAIEGVVLAQRWAAPKRYVEARLTAHPAIAAHQYMAHYLMTDPVERTAREFHELGARMRQTPGRFFTARNIWSLEHHRFLKTFVAPRIEVSPEALPFRPNRGLFVVVKHLKDAARAQEIAIWHDRVHVPDVLTVKGVTGCSWFQSDGRPIAGAAQIGTPVSRQVWVYYLDEDPLATVADLKAKRLQWRAAGRSLDMGDAMETVLAGPYENIDNPDNYDWTRR